MIAILHIIILFVRMFSLNNLNNMNTKLVAYHSYLFIFKYIVRLQAALYIL